MTRSTVSRHNLQKRGVQIAFASYDAHSSRNLPYSAGFAVAFGLPYDEALKAVTLNPAQIWGVADKLGSLDIGKTANIVVANGDPLDLKTDVKQVFIEGREVPMSSRQTRLRRSIFRTIETSRPGSLIRFEIVTVVWFGCDGTTIESADNRAVLPRR